MCIRDSLHAQPEIAVASTKVYLNEVVALYILYQILNNKEYKDSIKELVENLKKVSANKDYIYEYAKKISKVKNAYFVGRGFDYKLALEASLKLKEVSYIHCEALPAGELKHGSLALIKRDCVVIAILTQDDLVEKMLNNIHEINSRGAKVILFSPYADLEKFVSAHVLTPQVDNMLEPFAVMKPLQILAYKTALARNLDPDKPRNLAKSVTVE